MTEDEMVGWHHQLNGHEFEQAPRIGDVTVYIGRIVAEVEAPILWQPDAKNQLTGKDLDTGKD